VVAEIFEKCQNETTKRFLVGNTKFSILTNHGYNLYMFVDFILIITYDSTGLSKKIVESYSTNFIQLLIISVIMLCSK